MTTRSSDHSGSRDNLTHRKIEKLVAAQFERLAGTAMVVEDCDPHDFEASAVLRVVGDPTGQRILDVGCGKGRLAKFLANRGASIVGVDLVYAFLLVARRNVGRASFVRGTATNLPFRDASFDAALCVEVLEHIPNLEAAIRELSRILVPGGRAAIIDKNLLGLGFSAFLPNFIWKRIAEWRGHWMYPRGFPFREAWFIPPFLARVLKRYFRVVEVVYLPDRAYRNCPPYLKHMLRLFPVLCPDALWSCRK